MAKDILVRMKADTGNYDANIAKARKQLDGFAKDNFTAGGAIKGMTSQVVAAAAKFASFGAAIAGAMKVAKDAFLSNEEQLDEWNRTIESSKSVYKGFLDSLNSGDMSGFFQNIDDIVTAARRAYDALDDLQTFNAFNQRNIARTRKGLTESIVDYREGKGSAADVRDAADAYKKELKTRMELEQKAYDEAVGKLASERGVSKKDLRDAMSGTWGDYKSLKETPLTGKRTRLQGTPMFGGGYAVTENFAANKTEKLGEALRRINDTELQNLQELGARSEQTADDIAQIDKQVARVLSRENKTSGGGGGGNTKTATTPAPKQAPLIDPSKIVYKGPIPTLAKEDASKYTTAYVSSLQSTFTKAMQNSDFGSAEFTSAMEHMIDSTALSNLIQTAIENGINLDEMNIPNLIDLLLRPEGISDEKLQAVVDYINQYMGENPIKLNLDTGGLETAKAATKEAKDMSKEWQAAAQAIQSVGSAMGSIEDPAAKVAGTIAQAIASIALGYAQASVQASSMGPWAWIGFVASGLATMVATIATIKKTTAHADGGIIPGNSFSGDNNLAWVNSGEVVLNAAQQNTLAQRLTNGEGAVGGRTEATVSSENIRIVLRNGASRRGLSVNEYINL